MATEKKNIENIYQEAFQNATWDSDNDKDWNAIAYQLDKKRFYRFSWTRFNIYYTGAIGVSILLLLFLVFKRVSSENGKLEIGTNGFKTNQSLEPSEKQKTTNQTILQDQKSNSETNENTEVKNQSVIKSKANQTSAASISNSNTKTDTIINVPTSIIVSEPNLTKATDSTSTKPATIPKKTKKIVYIAKQDTIMVVDTVKTSKSKRKR